MVGGVGGGGVGAYVTLFVSVPAPVLMVTLAGGGAGGLSQTALTGLELYPLLC